MHDDFQIYIRDVIAKSPDRPDAIVPPPGPK
jgi:hypothetical protein